MQSTQRQTFLRDYYLCSALYECIFAYAIYTVLFSLRGLSVLQISLLLSWWALTSMILEVPTGALADTWSRKRMLTIAPLVKSLCFLVWTFAGGSFYLYALGFLLWSLGSSFVSGTTEALLYDTLAHHGCTGDYERIRGRAACYATLAMGAAMISGGVLAQYRVEAAVLLSVLPLLGSAFFASRLQEVPASTHGRERVRYVDHLKLAVMEMRSNRLLLYLTGYLLGVGIMGNLEEFDQLYYQLAKLPLFAFGIAGFAWALALAAGASHAHRLKGRTPVLYLFPCVMAAGLVLVSRHPSIPMIALLLLCYMLSAPLRVLTESSLQRAIRVESRATVTSSVALFSNLFAVIAPALCGLISRIWNLQAIYLATGVFLLGFAFWAFASRHRLQPAPPVRNDGT